MSCWSGRTFAVATLLFLEAESMRKPNGGNTSGNTSKDNTGNSKAKPLPARSAGKERHYYYYTLHPAVDDNGPLNYNRMWHMAGAES